jgi:hypothetical protein
MKNTYKAHHYEFFSTFVIYLGFPLDRRLVGPQSRSGLHGKEKNPFPLPGIGPLWSNPYPGLYTDQAIWALLLISLLMQFLLVVSLKALEPILSKLRVMKRPRFCLAGQYKSRSDC